MVSPKNRVVKYYLQKWNYLDRNVAHLNDTETIKAKILYSSLKELEPEERQFLADKYRVPNKPIKDAFIALEKKMDEKKYKEDRIAIETKLKPYILENIKKFEGALSEESKQHYERMMGQTQLAKYTYEIQWLRKEMQEQRTIVKKILERTELLDEMGMETEATLAAYEAFITEKGLQDELKSFVDNARISQIHLVK